MLRCIYILLKNWKPHLFIERHCTVRNEEKSIREPTRMYLQAFSAGNRSDVRTNLYDKRKRLPSEDGNIFMCVLWHLETSASSSIVIVRGCGWDRPAVAFCSPTCRVVPFRATLPRRNGLCMRRMVGRNTSTFDSDPSTMKWKLSFCLPTRNRTLDGM